MPRLLLGFAALAGFALPCVAEQTVSKSEMLIRLNLRPGRLPSRRSDTGYYQNSRR